MLLKTIVITVCLNQILCSLWDDQSNEFNCPSGGSVSFINNANPNGWVIMCDQSPPGNNLVRQKSWWSIAYFNWPITSTSTCSGMGVVTGLKPVYAQWSSNGRRYRRYQVICSDVKGYKHHKCYWTRTTDSFYKLKTLKVEDGYFLTGIHMREARRFGALNFRARLCTLNRRRECQDPNWEYYKYLCR